jgi:glutamyl-tRNA synthetase/glutamyl-Q tRNA(Asp) synthetase
MDLLNKLQTAFSSSVPITRFAPSPTGYLHQGHVANAIYVWGLAKALKGNVILRIEDHDRQRCLPEYERSLIQDLRWLNFIPDIPSMDDFDLPQTPYRQSNREKVYIRAYETLKMKGLIYACSCSRKELQNRGCYVAGDIRYDGYCRNRNLPEQGNGLRLILSEKEMSWTDIIQGEFKQTPSQQCGDVLIRDRRGNWNYQFCVVVDDIDQNVNFIIRGKDLLLSTARQLQIRTMLGDDLQPVYLHHDLICTDGFKLSKRQKSTSISSLRDEGINARDLIQNTADLLGLPDLSKTWPWSQYFKSHMENIMSVTKKSEV